MTFEEWWNTKDYPARCKGNCKEAFNAGYETMKAYNEKLLNSDIEKHNKIVELEAQIDNLKSIGKTSYIKGIRTMANALKEYDRTEGAWTDYFEHKVDEALKLLLKKGVIKENLTTKAECETQELLDKQIEATLKAVNELNEVKELVKSLLYCTKGTCANCGFVDCENFQMQRKTGSSI